MQKGHYLGIFAVLLAAAGCGQPANSLLTERGRLMLQEEPAGAVTVLEARDQLQPEQEVVLVGMIGGLPDPWVPGRAAFMIVDPACAHGDDAQCDCAFCEKKRPKNEALALIRFVDKDGKLLKIDAQKLFGVENDQLVVIRGKASRHQLGYLTVAASGMYLRK